MRATTLDTLVNRLASNDVAVVLLRSAADLHNRTLFVRVAIALAAELRLPDLPKCDHLFSEIVRHITDNPHQCPPNLSSAVAIFRDECQRKRKLHRFIADRFGLNRSTGQSSVQNLPKHFLDRQTSPYPPLGHFVSESQEIRDKWEQRLLKDPQPDRRQPRRPTHDLQPSELHLEVPADGSCVIVDSADGSIVAVVLWGIMQEDDQLQAEFLAWAVGTIQNGIAGRRTARAEDPGRMVQMGYSAGQRSKPAFDWVRNLLRKNELTPEFLASADYQASCLFALAWNICRAQLPKEIMDGWAGWLEHSGLLRMGAGVCMTGDRGDYQTRIGEYTTTFHNAELAPPTGLLNQNYARAMHFGHQPYRAVSVWRMHPQGYPNLYGCIRGLACLMWSQYRYARMPVFGNRASTVHHIEAHGVNRERARLEAGRGNVHWYN